MRCRDFELRLQEQLDRRAALSADPILARHADTCPRCAQRLRGIEVISGLLAGKNSSTVASRRARPRGAWSVLAMAGALAALLLAIRSVPHDIAPSPSDRQVVAADSDPAAGLAPPVDLTGVSPPVASDRSEASRWPSRRIPLPLTDAATSSLVYSAPRHWMELPVVIANRVGSGSWLQVTDSLKPVTRTVHSALDRLRQSLPVDDAQEVAPQAQRLPDLLLYARVC